MLTTSNNYKINTTYLQVAIISCKHINLQDICYYNICSVKTKKESKIKLFILFFFNFVNDYYYERVIFLSTHILYTSANVLYNWINTLIIIYFISITLKPQYELNNKHISVVANWVILFFRVGRARIWRICYTSRWIPHWRWTGRHGSYASGIKRSIQIIRQRRFTKYF